MITPSPQSGSTILAVDDDAGVLQLVGRILQNAGYQVVLAEGGRSAIRAFEDCASPVDLLLTDVMMPDLTGPVVAERLRERKPGLPVLFISGFHDASLIEGFIALNGFTLLPKPFTPAGLLRVVKDTLSSRAD